MSLRLIPVAVAPLAAKYFFEPESFHFDWIMAACLIGPFLIGGVYLMLTWKTVYSFTVDEEGITNSVNDVLVSSIRWEDVRKVNDWDPWYVKLFSASSRPIRVGYTLPIYSLTRRYIAEKVPAAKVKYMRFWTRPMKFSLWKTAIVVAGFYLLIGGLVAAMSYWDTLKFYR